ncbi:uncharacterized protein LOC134077095 isoform X2 [Sardina pilchardus]
MAQRWMLLAIFGSLSTVSECASLEVTCRDASIHYVKKVKVTCTIDYSTTVVCGFHNFSIKSIENNLAKLVSCNEAYRCDTIITEISINILNPRTGEYHFTLGTDCGNRSTSFNVTGVNIPKGRGPPRTNEIDIEVPAIGGLDGKTNWLNMLVVGICGTVMICLLLATVILLVQKGYLNAPLLQGSKPTKRSSLDILANFNKEEKC